MTSTAWAAAGPDLQVITYPPVGGVAAALQRIPPTNPKSIDIAFPSSAMKAAALAYRVPELHFCQPLALFRAIQPTINEALPETS
jgi:hypothetical protein